MVVLFYFTPFTPIFTPISYPSYPKKPQVGTGKLLDRIKSRMLKAVQIKVFDDL